MYIEKKVIGTIPKCYAITPLRYGGQEHLLVASEQRERCVLYDLDGNEKAIVWSEPGGVMTMLQIPGSDGAFLSTQKFYSPNNARDAKLVIASPKEDGGWSVRTLTDMPFVHRFGILCRNETAYLIACTVKSDQLHEDNDWSFPGKVYGCRLPDDFGGFDDSHPLEMDVIMDGLVKNHGYYKIDEDGVDKALISCDSGVYKLAPPAFPGLSWEIERILDTPASDAVLVDLDEDGLCELAVISPFHGDKISIYRQENGGFVKVYDYEKPAPFSHAIYGGMLAKTPAVIIGHREGEQNLLMFTWNKERKNFEAQIIDRGCGSANIHCFFHNGNDYILSANREVDEVALYKISVKKES